MLGKLWAFLGGQESVFGVHPQKKPNYRAGDGDGAFKTFRDTLGTGYTQILGFFGGKSRNSQNFGMGTKVRILKIFTTLRPYSHLKYAEF